MTTKEQHDKLKEINKDLRETNEDLLRAMEVTVHRLHRLGLETSVLEAAIAKAETR